MDEKLRGNVAVHMVEFMQIAYKAKKSAEMKPINCVADEIFHQTSKSIPVSSYIQIEQDLESARELRCTILEDQSIITQQR